MDAVSRAGPAFHQVLVWRSGSAVLAAMLNNSRLLSSSVLALLPRNEQGSIPLAGGRRRRPEAAAKALGKHAVPRAV